MFDQNESSFITDQTQLLISVTELAADIMFETAFAVQSWAQNLREELL
jgi:hypothetical protein